MKTTQNKYKLPIDPAEFNEMTYSERLDLWYEKMPIGDGSHSYDENYNIVLSIMPDENNPEQVVQYNEYQIKWHIRLLNQTFEHCPDKNPCKTFEQLKKEFTETIKKALPNRQEEKVIEQINKYKSICNKEYFRNYETYSLNDLTQVKGIVDAGEFIKLNAIMEYVQFLEDFIKNGFAEKEIKKLNDWEALYNGLIKGYIKNATCAVFAEVMEYKVRPKGAEKIIWIGSKTDAIYFQKEVFKAKMELFNDCFIPPDGKKFHWDGKEITGRKQPFLDILKLAPMKE